MPLKPILTQGSEMTKKIVISAILLILGVVLFLNKSHLSNLSQKPLEAIASSAPQNQADSLRVISTKPSPLEGVTILPTQSIEITLNKQVGAEFKYHFDPVVESKVEELVNTNNQQATYKISFIKPLELGSGYTLYIDPGTHTQDKQNLDHEYIYHFSTISYKGV